MLDFPGILIMFHCGEQTGYAIAKLEKIFYSAALAAGFPEEAIFWSYNGLAMEQNGSIPLKRKIHCRYNDVEGDHLIEFVRRNNIKQVLAFDLGFPSPVITHLKKAGVEWLTSYWGASMSGVNSGFKLLLKKIEYRLRKNKPDYFIFESGAMQFSATNGRGVAKIDTEVIHLGVDTEIFYSEYGECHYAHQALNIPAERHLVFYSGHMEERKGVSVIMRAALALADKKQLNNWHFVCCGNRPGEEKIFLEMLKGSDANERVTFAGYRSDIAELMRSARVGVIASTGWDSFTMSSIEMMASGLPLIVSNLQGLSETIEDGINGYLIPPGDHLQLAEKLNYLFSHLDICSRFSQQSRRRAVDKFAVERQVNNLKIVLSKRPKNKLV